MALLGTRDRRAVAACPECGTPPPSSARFCGACGARLLGPPEPAAEVLLPQRPSTADPGRRPARRALVTLGVLLALVAGVLVLTRGPAPVDVLTDEGRTHRGPGATGVTSATAVVPERIAWRWTFEQQELGFDLPENQLPTIDGTASVGDLALISVDGEVHAVDPTTGARRWRARFGGQHLTTVDGALVVHAGSRLVHVDAATGRVVREVDTGVGGFALGQPVIHDGVAVLDRLQSGVVGVDVVTGETRWRVESAWAQLVEGAGGVAFLVVEDPTPPGRQELLVVDAATGDELWRDPDPWGWFPTVVGDVAIRDREFGGTEALDLRTGEVRWTAEQSDLGTHAIPVGDDRVAVWSLASTATRDPRLLVYDASTGTEVERIDLPDLGRSSIVVTDAGIVARDGVEVFLWRDGRKVWTAITQIDDRGEDAPLHVVGDLVLAARTDEVVALSLEHGREVWSLPVAPRRWFWWGQGVLTSGDDLLVLSGGWGHIGVALQRTTGLRAWTQRSLEPMSGLDRGLVSLNEGNLRRLAPDGEIVWRTDDEAPHRFSAARVGDDLLVAAGEAFDDRQMASEPRQDLEVLRLTDGRVIDRLTGAGGWIAAVVDDAVYVESYGDAALRRVDLVDETLVERWSTDRYSGDRRVMATSAHVVLLDAAGATVVDPADGNEVRRIAFGRVVPQEAALHGATLVVTDGDRTLEAWDVRNGERRWATTLGAPLEAAVTVAGAIAYVMDHDGGLNLVDVRDGDVVTRFDAGVTAGDAALVADGHVFIPTTTGDLVALR